MRPYTTLIAAALATGLAATPLHAEEYIIDTQGAHASINFKIKHLGYSWLLGRFDGFSGHFSYDEKDPAAAKVSVEIDTTSIDSNHAERDKHLRSGDFLDVAQFPKASFVSTAFTPTGEGQATLSGNFTFHGVTNPMEIAVTEIGAGPDPWGGFRRGFEGHTSFKLKDYGIDYDLGPASQEVEIYLSVEGIRQ